jgi:hypothetical protein
MANTKLSQAAPGTVVKTNYNGAPTNFVVLHQGKPSPIYDDSFNGGTIMRFESIPENYQWTTTGTNDYAASSVQAHIQEYVQYFDPGMAVTTLPSIPVWNWFWWLRGNTRK